MENARAHVFIQGSVQGVFYRSWTHKTALELGLTGFVKNLEDGRVEALFEGEKSKVEEMIEKCKSGSNASNVKHIDVVWEEPKRDYSDFVIH
jgi:acylphosphatase